MSVEEKSFATIPFLFKTRTASLTVGFVILNSFAKWLTLQNSFLFWENQELSSNGHKAKVKFEITNQKREANVWVTWVVRNIGEGVLGHAHIGKGVVEVTLGDYNCDGKFELYDVKTVEKIMTHELGHSIGLEHVSDPNSIMYTSLKPNYAYCLLG